ncbi:MULTISPECIES: GNAT family N-acetyltransferase [Streptococcus]|uniref:GNAT family N-acetyltransferase n=1 Tax=Streptococcus caledonicus TaxID=2614158 RepID=A0ABW0UGC6_9STRE|nr:GNAT family N-acetyltransferase [Streptococcus sp. S784/96/1]
MIAVRALTIDDKIQAAALLAAFRSTLRSFKNRQVALDLEEGAEEFTFFLDEKYPMYGAFIEQVLIGYVVCKVEGSLVWIEQLFVSEAFRRQGGAAVLFEKANQLSQSVGGETLFQYVHPNNHEMLSFLRSQGYTVLNLIEVRKPYQGEQLTQTIYVDDEPFDY